MNTNTKTKSNDYPSIKTTNRALSDKDKERAPGERARLVSAGDVLPDAGPTTAENERIEHGMVRSGIRLFKFWFSVSRSEQRRRFKEREGHPLKQWKLSPIDKASLDKWTDYTRAKENMFLHCDTSDAPWTVIKSDCKKRARLNAMRYVLHRLPYSRRNLEAIGAVDPLIVGRPSLVASAGEDLLASGLND